MQLITYNLKSIALKAFSTRSINAGVIVIPCAVWAAAALVGIKLVDVPQPKPMQGFSPNFQDMFTQRRSRADYVGIWQQLLPWQHFQDFLVVKFVGVTQSKPMHGFSPNFQICFVTAINILCKFGEDIIITE